MAKASNNELENDTIKEVKQEIKDCFIITPIGSRDSETFSKMTGLLEAVLKPVLAKHGFNAVAAHEIASPGSITKQILRHIVEDQLVIANLTGLNPNVMYELAVRHAVKLPLLMLAEHGTTLPFDVNDQRTIFYHDTFSGVEACKIELEQKLMHVISDDYHVENPIYDAIGTNKLIKEVGAYSQEGILINRLDQIESAIFNLTNSHKVDKMPRIWAGDIGSNVGTKFLKLKLRDGVLTSSVFDNVGPIVDPYGIKYKLSQTLNVSSLVLELYNVSEDTSRTIAKSLVEIDGVRGVEFF